MQVRSGEFDTTVSPSDLGMSASLMLEAYSNKYFVQTFQWIKLDEVKQRFVNGIKENPQFTDKEINTLAKAEAALFYLTYVVGFMNPALRLTGEIFPTYFPAVAVTDKKHANYILTQVNNTLKMFDEANTDPKALECNIVLIDLFCHLLYQLAHDNIHIYLYQSTQNITAEQRVQLGSDIDKIAHTDRFRGQSADDVSDFTHGYLNFPEDYLKKMMRTETFEKTHLDMTRDLFDTSTVKLETTADLSEIFKLSLEEIAKLVDPDKSKIIKAGLGMALLAGVVDRLNKSKQFNEENSTAIAVDYSVYPASSPHLFFCQKDYSKNGLDILINQCIDSFNNNFEVLLSQYRNSARFRS